MADDYRDLFGRFIEAVWLNGDVDAVADFFTNDAQLDGIAGDISLRAEDFVTWSQAILMLVSEPSVDVLRTVQNGDWISALVRCRGTVSRTGQPVEITGQTMLRVEDGKFAEAYNNYDMVGFFTQIGVLPPDAFEKVLANAGSF